MSTPKRKPKTPASNSKTSTAAATGAGVGAAAKSEKASTAARRTPRQSADAVPVTVAMDMLRSALNECAKAGLKIGTAALQRHGSVQIMVRGISDPADFEGF